jgi:lauroyl/myristoyl acyltransferase
VTAAYLGHEVSFPSGPASLAHLTGAPLMTGAVVRRGTLDHEVVIDEPIRASRDLPQPEFVEAAIHEFARRLEERVRAHPDSRPRTKFDKVPPDVTEQ